MNMHHAQKVPVCWLSPVACKIKSVHKMRRCHFSKGASIPPRLGQKGSRLVIALKKPTLLTQPAHRLSAVLYGLF